MSDPNSTVTKTIDVLAASSIVGTIFGYLPSIAAIISIIWFCIQIYESKTFTKLKSDYLLNRKAKKIAKLRAKEKILAAQIAAIETVRLAKVEAQEKIASAKVEAILDIVHNNTDDNVSRL